MKKKGRVALEILIILVVMVFTSALILVLVKTGVIEVRSGVAAEPVLNAEFLPVGKIGNLLVRQFDFCSLVDEDYNCLETADTFSPGSEVYFRFVVESSTYNGGIILVENYRIISPSGNLVLEAEKKDNFNLELKSSEKIEQVLFRDFFVLDADVPLGEYTLELIVSNPLLDKNVKLAKNFEVVNIPFEPVENFVEEDEA